MADRRLVSCPHPPILVLIGQIGCGKSESARLAAAKTGARLVTIDDLRSHRLETSASGIAATLLAIPPQTPLIFECSGAASDFEELLAILARNGRSSTVVLLDCSIETAVGRIGKRSEWVAPMFGGSWARQLRWTETRLRMVPAAATVNTDKTTPEEVAETVLTAWEAAQKQVDRADPMPPRGVFSYSQLDLFDVCPLAYRYKYVDQQAEALETFEMFLGGRLHEALSFLYQLGRFPEVSEEQVLAFFEARLDAMLPPTAPADQVAELRQRGSEALRFHHAAVYRHDTLETLAVESRFTLELSAELSFVGKVDRVAVSPSGTIGVIEYKTAVRGESSKPRVPDLLQLAAYGAAAMLEYRTPTVFARRHFVETGTDEKILIERGDLSRIRLALLRWIAGLKRTDELKARPGRHCGACQFNPVCPKAAVPRRTASWLVESEGGVSRQPVSP